LGQVGEASGDAGIVMPEPRFIDGERPATKRLGFSEFAESLKWHG